MDRGVGPCTVQEATKQFLQVFEKSAPHLSALDSGFEAFGSIVLLFFFLEPGLPDGTFSNQNPNLGKFWRVLKRKILAYYMDIWSILQ
jgi:hypothetical protein